MLPAVNFDSISAQRRTVCRSREKNSSPGWKASATGEFVPR